MRMTRPYVILSAAMTLDGKIATVAGDSRISCEADLDRVHRLRAGVDAVMVGVGTVLADDPLLTVRRVQGKNPMRVVVDSIARTPPKARVLDDSAPTIITVTRNAPKRRLRNLRSRGAKIIVTGLKEVNLRKLLERLHSLGVRRLMLEGGSTLNWGMLRCGLIDEVRVALAPKMVGGARAKSLIGGKGFAKIKEGTELKLSRVERVGEDLLLVYRVRGGGIAKKAR